MSFSFDPPRRAELSPCSIVDNVRASIIVVSDTEIKSYFNVHFRANIFGKGINFLISSAIN